MSLATGIKGSRVPTISSWRTQSGQKTQAPSNQSLLLWPKTVEKKILPDIHCIIHSLFYPDVEYLMVPTVAASGRHFSYRYLPLEQSLARMFCKGWDSISDFEGHTISTTTTQPWMAANTACVLLWLRVGKSLRTSTSGSLGWTKAEVYCWKIPVAGHFKKEDCAYLPSTPSPAHKTRFQSLCFLGSWIS